MIALLVLGKDSLSLSFEVAVKALRFDLKIWPASLTCDRINNEKFRQMVSVCVKNVLPFSYVLCDTWYTNSENNKQVRGHKKHVIGAVKTNLKVARLWACKNAGKFVRLNKLKWVMGLK